MNTKQTRPSWLAILVDKDVLSSLFFIAAGAFFVFGSMRLNFGDASRMGPGFFPRIVGGALVLLGIFIGLRGLLTARRGEGQTSARVKWIPVLTVFTAVLAFVLTIREAGLIIAAVLLVGIGGAACQDRRWKELAIASILLSIGAGLLFVWGLGLQAPLFPWK